VTGRGVRTGLNEAAANNLEIFEEDHSGLANVGKPVTYEIIKKQAESIDFRGTTSNGGQFDRGGANILEAATNLWVKSWRSSECLAVLRVMAHHGSQIQRRRKKIKRRSVYEYGDKSELDDPRAATGRMCNPRRITVRTADCWNARKGC
jgi:hypothetical protein